MGRECADYQELKIQEHVQRLAVGSVPRSMCVLLEHDLVDRCKAGDDIVISGVLMRRWRPVTPGVRCEVRSVQSAARFRFTRRDDGSVRETDGTTSRK